MSELRHDRPKTLTFRAVAVALFATLVAAMWVHFHEVLVPQPQPQPLAENSPPAAAVGLLLPILVVSMLVGLIARPARLHRGELAVVYTVLVIATPLFSQGMWHRFIGLAIAIPHHEHNLVLADSYSRRLWPHGEQLVEDPRLERDEPLEGVGFAVTPRGGARIVEADESPIGPLRAVQLDAGPAEGAGVVARWRIDRQADDGTARFAPGERCYATALLRIDRMRPGGRVTISLVTATGDRVLIHRATRPRPETFSRPGGFERVGSPYVPIPAGPGDYIDLEVRVQGDTAAAVTDLTFFSNEAIARLHKGSTEMTAESAAALGGSAREGVLVRPDNLWSFAGLWYVVRGYVPWDQWATPLAYWTAIVLAIFAATLGIAAILRKQWVDHERFTFPMVVVPQSLIDTATPAGRRLGGLWRSRAFWVGVVLAVAYGSLAGLANYIPGVPDPRIEVPLADYVSSPALTSFLQGSTGTGTFRLVLLYAAIALFVDLRLLGSVLVFFVLARVPFFFGETMGWKLIDGPLDSYPFVHEQHTGAFLCLAGVVIWTSRRHLLGVLKTAVGRPGGVDDAAEPMRYRTAVLLLAGSFVAFGVWGALTGMGATSSLLFFGFIVICALAAARIRTEFGAPASYFTPYFPFLIFFLLGGLAVFDTQTVVLAYVAGGFMAVAQFLMFAPSQVEMMTLGDRLGAGRRGMNAAMWLGVVAGVLLGGYVMLVWAYGVGGENIDYMRNWAISQDWYFSSLRRAVVDADAAVTAGRPTQSLHAGPLTAVGVGAGITAVLTVLRSLLPGFWLHPIGYVLANTFFIDQVWGSVLVAWVVKWLALRIGGARLVREQLTPLGVGLFVGAVLAIIGWDAVAAWRMAAGAAEVHVLFP